MTLLHQATSSRRTSHGCTAERTTVLNIIQCHSYLVLPFAIDTLTAHCISLTCLVEQDPGTISTPRQYLKTVVLHSLGTDWPLFEFSDEECRVSSERSTHQRSSILACNFWAAVTHSTTIIERSSPFLLHRSIVDRSTLSPDFVPTRYCTLSHATRCCQETKHELDRPVSILASTRHTTRADEVQLEQATVRTRKGIH